MPTSAIVETGEFVAVMVPVLFRAAALASATRNPTVIHKPQEWLPGSETEIERASRVNILSGLDIEIQEMVLSVVLQHWPFVSVMVEEDTPTRAKFMESSDFRILIDPVDGTRNYVEGDRRYCHIVSLASGGEMLVTLVYSHAVERLFVAIAGKGASVFSSNHESERVRIANSKSKILFHHVRIPEVVVGELESAGFRPAVSVQNATDILTLLNGQASGFISHTPKVYDVWSPGMIIQEAGGWVSDWLGRPLVFRGEERVPHVLIASSCDVADLVSKRLSSFVGT